ncbi:dTDP-glucose 4,6-dehydratase [Anatilimnocola aggregata]|uniref:dTDP-glucose 4,6-dehydratase n=1 Tax=Anatilimnocola aggregata TaxID=2528021 RepID=A0A517Y4Q1_9BACT|nr:NAD-dependent epimerase/dehydratase family protein [Anatilimnocola aggregata]QDU25176.1 dTDP-glucose 4,6-dehydratase [Anatilimnocola aggregata]
MTVLVTGGAGFIGSHLCRALAAAGYERIVALDNFNSYYDPPLKRASAAELAVLPQVKIIEADFCDAPAMARLFATERFRHVIHLGGSPGVPYSVRQPAEVLHNNVQGTLSLLEAARANPVERFLFSSSSTVYGQGVAAPFVEDAPLGVPASPYGVSKRAAELLGLNYFRLHQVPFVALRLFNVYGPRLRPELSLATFARKILAGEPLPLFGDGSVLRDFTHVSDICRGILSALTAPHVAGECLNLGHDQPIAMRHLINLIEQAAGRRAQIEYLPPRGEDLPLTHADLTKSRRLLGYSPRVAIAEGVHEYISWLQTLPRSSVTP